MKIGEAATASGLSVKAIRHYEAVDLLPRVSREGVYRDFSPADITRLKTIAHCRSLGFSVTELRDILGLVAQAAPACPPPGAMADLVAAKLDALRSQMRDMERRAGQLEQIAQYLEDRRGP